MKKVNNNAGFTLIEILISTAIVLSSGTALTWTYSNMQQANRKLALNASVLTLESELTESPLDSANYSDNVKTQLRDRRLPPTGLQFNLTGRSVRPFAITLIPGTPNVLDENLAPCNTYGVGRCGIRLRLEMRGIGGKIAYAYRIETKFSDLSYSYAGAGSSGAGDFDDPATWPDSEFRLTIPHDYYLESLLIACGANGLALSGIDATTGKAVCIQEPEAADICPENSFPKRVAYSDSNGKRQLKVECSGTIQPASCPTGYFLQSVDTRTLDSSIPHKVGRCVFGGRNTSTLAIARSSKRIFGQLCPPGYRSQSRCAIEPTSVVSTSGNCPACSTFSPNCSAAVVTSPFPGDYLKTIPYQCNGGTVPHPAVPGRAVLTENVPTPGYVNCQLELEQQDCGATWTANVHLELTCVIDPAQMQELADVR